MEFSDVLKSNALARRLKKTDTKKTIPPLNTKPKTNEEYKKYKVKELKDILKNIGLPVSGTKQNLINRLRAFEQIDFEYVEPVKKERKKNTIYDFRMIDAMLLPNIKKMATHYGLKITGKKRDVIDRIISYVKDKGFVLDSKLPYKSFPIEEEIPSTTPVYKNINIIRKTSKKDIPKKTPKDKILLLAEEWDTQQMPILLYQLFPKVYDNIEKKINQLINKNYGISTSYLASFVKELIPGLFKYNINVEQLYDGLYDLAKYISGNYYNFAEKYDDFKMIEKYLPRNSITKESKIILLKHLRKTKNNPEIQIFPGLAKKSDTNESYNKIIDSVIKQLEKKSNKLL